MKSIQLAVALAALTIAPAAFARVDLSVSFDPPTAPLVDVPAAYAVHVDNLGNKTAKNVRVSVELPPTGTSPTQHVMGDLSNVDPACTLNGTTLDCDLGSIGRNGSKSVGFTLALPAAMRPLGFVVEASTTTRERDLSNNAVSHVVTPTYVDTPIAAPVDLLNRHCTGQGLSAFYECELYPSSITSHAITLNPDQSITFDNAPPTFTGQWVQAAPDELSFIYLDGGNLVAHFTGYGVGGGCFEGLTLFFNSPYVAPYQVCIQ